MLWDEFISEKVQLKLKIFFYVMNNNEKSIEEILKELQISKRQFRALITELNEDIRNSCSTEEMAVEISEHIVVVYGNKNSFFHVYRKLRQYYLNSSPHFEILSLIVKKGEISVQNISECLNYSLSYCYQVIREINEKFKKLQVNIVITKENGHCLLSGNEIELRLLFYKLYLHTQPCKDWPRRTVSKEVIERYTDGDYEEFFSDSSFSVTYREELLFAIFEYRIKGGDVINDLPLDLQEIVQLMMGESSFEKKGQLCLKQEDSIVQESKGFELEIFNYLRNLLIAYPKDEIEMIGRRFVKHQENAIIKESIDLVEEIMSIVSFEKNNDEYYQFIYFTVLYYSAYKKLNFVMYQMPFSNYRKVESNLSTETILTVKEKVNIMLKAQQVNHSDRVTENLYLIFLSMYHKKKATKIKIYIEFSSISITEYILKNVISTLFNLNLLELVNNLDEADLIISDNTHLNLSDKHFLYFSSVYSENDWQKLFKEITLLLVKNY